MSLSANAGFEALDQGSSLKVASALNCDVGLTCSKKRGTVSVSATHIGAIEAAVAGTLTAAKCGKTFYNTAAVELDLPEASTVLGCRYTFVTLNASNFDIDPDDADQILVQTDAAGDRTRNATVGNSITLEAVSASQWAVVGILGTWSDAN
jgi:hypothetical protein